MKHRYLRKKEMILKKTVTVVGTTLLLGMGTIFSVPYVKAESSISKVESEITQIQSQLSKVNEQMKRVDQAILDNQSMIKETEENIKITQSEMVQIQKEMLPIKERMEKRNEILKGRVVSIQESGGVISYIDVVLGASSFSDFVSRVTAVSTIIEADQDLMEEHQNDLKEVESKKESIEKKLQYLADTKIELEGMHAQIAEQKTQNDALKEKLKNQEKNKLAEKNELLSEIVQPVNAISFGNTSHNKRTKKQINRLFTLPNTSQVSGDINTVITSGYKYIGNSVYVFGGGRSTHDIANGRFDCSGFVHWAFSQAGVNVGSSTDSLKNQGSRVSVSEMKPGDLVFFDTYKRDGHVGIYIGNGKFIGSQSSTGVAIANMSSGYWADAFNGRVKRIMN